MGGANGVLRTGDSEKHVADRVIKKRMEMSRIDHLRNTGCWRW